jgi:hypothetical protein
LPNLKDATHYITLANMNKKQIIFLAFIIITLVIILRSCWNTTDNQDITVFYLVDRTQTDSLGNTLHISFDAQGGSARITFNGDTIQLQQDTTGEGISYSSPEYRFHEYKNKISLFKNGEKVFESTK